MILGEKGAGKTTLLCRLLSMSCFDFIANDRLLVSQSLNLTYVPMAIRLTPKTIQSIPELASYYELEKNYLRRNTLPLESIPPQDYKIELTPNELSKALNVTLAVHGTLQLIIQPNFQLTATKCFIEEMRSLDEKYALLKASCFTPRDEKWTELWITVREKSDEELDQEAEELCYQLARQIPFYRLTYGPNCEPEIIKDFILPHLSLALSTDCNKVLSAS
jgi:hypothetical protein